MYKLTYIKGFILGVGFSLLYSCSPTYKFYQKEFILNYEPGVYYAGSSSDLKFPYVKDTSGYFYHIGCGLPDGSKLGAYGVDISHHNGKVNWRELLSDTIPEPVSFAIIKASEGKSNKDSLFGRNWANAKKSGLITGAYHFFVQTDDPTEQAKNFLSILNLKSGDLLPILDIEPNCIWMKGCPDLLIKEKDLVKNLKLFIKTIEDTLKLKVVIYTNEAFFNRYLSSDFKQNSFWIARYSKSPPSCFSLYKEMNYTDPCQQNNLKIGWQYTNIGRIKGVSRDVDIDIFSEYLMQKILIK